MPVVYFVHIVAGSVALVAGYSALFARKGANVHRAAGRIFVYAMLTMSFIGMSMSAIRGIAPAFNIPAGLLTIYLVVTAFTTVQPASPWSRFANHAALLIGVTVSVIDITFVTQALLPGGRETWQAAPFSIFGLAAVLGVSGDVRTLRSGVLTGSARIARHLWRMCFVLFIAALSFFIGQAHVIPEPIRIRPLLAVPVLGVLVAMFYWLWRVRMKRNLQRIVLASAAPVLS